MVSKLNEDPKNAPPKKQKQEAYVPHPELGESDDANTIAKKPSHTQEAKPEEKKQGGE